MTLSNKSDDEEEELQKKIREEILLLMVNRSREKIESDSMNWIKEFFEIEETSKGEKILVLKQVRKNLDSLLNEFKKESSNMKNSINNKIETILQESLYKNSKKGFNDFLTIAKNKPEEFNNKFNIITKEKLDELISLVHEAHDQINFPDNLGYPPVDPYHNSNPYGDDHV